MTSGNKYHRTIHGLSGGEATVDVYSVLLAFVVTCPGRQHAIKKLLCAGIRGKGDEAQDLREARDALDRAIQEAERGGRRRLAYVDGGPVYTAVPEEDAEGGLRGHTTEPEPPLMSAAALEELGTTGSACVCCSCGELIDACTCHDVKATIPARLADTLARAAGMASNSGRKLDQYPMLEILEEVATELGKLKAKENDAEQLRASFRRRRSELAAAHEALNTLGVESGALPKRLTQVVKAERPMPAVTRARLERELAEERALALAGERGNMLDAIAKALGTSWKGAAGTAQAMTEEARLCLEILAKAGINAATPSQGARMAGEILGHLRDRLKE